MFGLVFALLFGVLSGWASSVILKIETDEGAFLNMGLGAVGGAIAVSLLRLRGIMGNDLEEALSLPVVLVALSGAALMIGVAHLLRRYRVLRFVH
jgi:uncharacterized membrane protein YeaQ/YmgE (transglycosylase-associated protein family)